MSHVVTNPRLAGLGQDDEGEDILGLPTLSIDPTVLAVGGGLLLMAAFLIGGRNPERRARKAQLKKRISSLRKQYRSL